MAAFPYYLLAALEAGKNMLVGAGLRSTVAAAVRGEERIQTRDAAQQGGLRRRSPSPRRVAPRHAAGGGALRDHRAGWRGAEDARPVERMRKEEEEYDVWDPRVSGCGGGELKKRLQFGE